MRRIVDLTLPDPVTATRIPLLRLRLPRLPSERRDARRALCSPGILSVGQPCLGKLGDSFSAFTKSARLVAVDSCQFSVLFNGVSK